MRTYWDSTALLNVLCSQPVVDRLHEEEHVARIHAFVETFHHLSGRGLPIKGGTKLYVTPADSAAMIRRLAKKLTAFDLNLEQMLAALDDAQAAGISGRMIHDWMHLRAAKLAGADIVLTRDGPMAALAAKEGLKTEWP